MASTDRLTKCIEDVEVFLHAAPGEASSLWAKSLAEVRSALLDTTRQDAALKQLESYFGGMGTLNDLVFCALNGNVPPNHTEAQANAEFERLLNRCFREIRLFRAPLFDRVLWGWLSWRHRDELPPRIKKSFRKSAV